MASFEKVRDVHGWLADCEAFEFRATTLKVGLLRWLFNLKYEVPKEGFQVSENKTVDGMEEGYFYLVAFTCGLRFPLSNFTMEVLEVYGVTPS